MFELFKGGMNRLLLRSYPTESHPTRVEIMFMGTEFIDLPTFFEGLEIRDVTKTEEGERIAQSRRLPADHGLRIFEINSGVVVGHVVAGDVGYIEDDRGIGDPSAFFLMDP